jgi:hypothetical protein
VKKPALVLALSLASLACAEKVDCGRMMSKLDECGAALARQVIAREAAAAREPPRDVPDDVLQSIISMVAQPYNKQCDDKGGKLDDAAELNECLAKSTCDDFAACMVSHVK